MTSTHESRWQAVVVVDMQNDFFNDPELDQLSTTSSPPATR